MEDDEGLSGTREAAELLGMSRQTISNWLTGHGTPEGFPKPVDRIAAGPVWRTADLVAFKSARDAG